MKRTPVTIAVLLAIMLLLSACGGASVDPSTAPTATAAPEPTASEEAAATTSPEAAEEDADDTDLSQYQLCDDGVGLSVRIGNDMERQESEGLAMFYVGDACMMSVVKEANSDYAAQGVDAENMTVEEYAEVIETANEMSEKFEKDSYGNLAVTYERNVDGTDFYYYSTVRKGTDAFWLVGFACISGDEGEYLPLFELWGSSITVE